LQPISAKPEWNSLSRYRPAISIAKHTKFVGKCCLCEASRVPAYKPNAINCLWLIY